MCKIYILVYKVTDTYYARYRKRDKAIQADDFYAFGENKERKKESEIKILKSA